jgi:hypothetical protein
VRPEVCRMRRRVAHAFAAPHYCGRRK